MTAAAPASTPSRVPPASGGPARAAPHRVVIVGGGAGGLELATRLPSRLRRVLPGAEVTLVDRNGSHVWKPRLHEVAAGTLDTAQEQVSYLVHAQRHGFTFRPGTLRGLDRAARRITLGALQDASGRDTLTATLPYDTLVLAVGSHADDFGTPGAAEHCRFIDSRDQAEAFNVALREAVIRTLDDPASPTVSVAVVGAGATGVELSAEINHALALVSGYGLPALRERLRLTLVEAAPRILPALPERVSGAVAAVLRGLGVEIVTGDSVASVDAAGMTLRSGRRVEASLRVWAAGVRAPAILGTLDGLEVDRAGRLVVDEALRTAADPSVLALGDCAGLVPPGAGRSLSATAQVAHQEAAFLARDLPARLGGAAPGAFRHRDMGSLVSLGGYDAFGSLARLGVLPGGFIAGRIAQVSYALLYRQHQLTLHGPWRSTLLWAAEGMQRLARPRVRLH